MIWANCFGSGRFGGKQEKNPNERIVPQGNDATDKMIDYLKPLFIGKGRIPYESGIPVQSF